MRRRISLTLILLLATAAQAQVPASAAIALSPGSLVLTGISTDAADEFKEVYLGSLGSPTDGTNALERAALLDSYLHAYGKSCPRYIPADGVELTETVCRTSQLTYNGLGRSERCIDYQQQPTGVFADRNLQSLSASLEAAAVKQTLQSGAGALSGYRVAVEIRAETSTLIADNGCDSAALRRYQDNLVRLLRNAAPLSVADRAYKPPINPIKSSPLPSPSLPHAVAAGPHPPPTNLPDWVVPGRAKVAPTLFPQDRARFAEIMDRLEDNIGREGWISAREEIARLHQMWDAYGDRCHIHEDESGCDGRAALGDFQGQLYSFVTGKQYAHK